MPKEIKIEEDVKMLDVKDFESHIVKQKDVPVRRIYGTNFDKAALSLTNSTEVLFADPSRSEKKGETYWITGAQYAKQYYDKEKKMPSLAHMDDVRCLVMTNEGNYFPRATLHRNVWVERTKGMTNTQYWHKKYVAAKQILVNNGLSNELYDGIVQQNGGDWKLPLEKRLVDTPTGIRKQNYEYKNPRQAGVENENILLINKKAGVYKSFDIDRDSEDALLPVRKLEEKYGGQIQLRSTESNGFHAASYLQSVNKDLEAAQERFDSIVMKDVNTNKNLPDVGVLVFGRMYDVSVIFDVAKIDEKNRLAALVEEKDAAKKQALDQPTEMENLADMLRSGDPSVAPIIRVRSRVGGYHTAEYARNDDPHRFNELMTKRDIPVKVGDPDILDKDTRQYVFNYGLPDVLVDTGKGYLEDGQSVLSDLADDETILSKYNKDQILITNFDKSMNSSGFYGQVGVLESKNKLGSANLHAMKLIQMDKYLKPRPDLTQDILKKPESLAYSSRGLDERQSVHGR